jgi:hypothetical protein
MPGMKRVLVPILLLVLLAGGGYAGWTWGKPVLERMKEERQKAAAAPLYVTLEPLVVPVIENGTVTRHLQIALSVEVAGLSGDARLRNALPRVVDAFTTELYGLMALRFVREGGVDMPLVKQRLLLAASRELGDGVMTDILIRGVEETPGEGASRPAGA